MTFFVIVKLMIAIMIVVMIIVIVVVVAAVISNIIIYFVWAEALYKPLGFFASPAQYGLYFVFRF